jgi:RNase H-fold protein (predicted Holliday junction resolvase)
MSLYISIDPGIKKCGLLLADMQSGNVIEAGIASINRFSDLVSLWNEDYQIIKVIVGDGTNCRYIESQLKRNNFLNINYVNERGSTLRARFRYWEIWPPNYFIRWLPKEILFPPENLDAIVALILLEDFLNYKFIWPDQVDIKIWL